MALRKDAPRSARAIERAALQAKYKDITLPGLEALEENRLNNPQALKDLKRELRKYYTDARAIANKRIERFQKSDVPYSDEPPQFPKTSELSDSELFRAVADVNRFLTAPATASLQSRRKEYQDLLDDLHEKGMTFLRLEDLKYWDRFRKWLRAANILGKPYAAGDILGDIFAQSVEEQNPTSERWQELYNEVSNLMGKNEPRKRRGRSRRK
jgi:hypothetical protein